MTPRPCAAFYSTGVSRFPSFYAPPDRGPKCRVRFPIGLVTTRSPPSCIKTTVEIGVLYALHLRRMQDAEMLVGYIDVSDLRCVNPFLALYNNPLDNARPHYSPPFTICH
ncbi:hypothetical protein TRVL_06317 [Trypanosoma vivax]|nr:hypothetical protein TRVL_06317 [Trypanosoma vivax]